MDATFHPDLRAGVTTYLQGDYPSAERQLSEAVQFRPDWAEGWSYLGFSQYMQKKYPEASASLERAVMIDSENAEARYGLGLVHAAMRQVDAAIACWDETVRVKPDHADAKRSLVGGLIFRAQQEIAAKDYDRAERDLDRAIKVDRTQSQAALVLANHFIEQSMTARAQKVVGEAISRMPDDPQLVALAAKLDVRPDHDLQVLAQQQQARRQVAKSQEVPCPACKRPVMEWAAICPHCNTQIKAMPSQFAGRQDATKAYAWQDVMYYIMVSLWMLNSLAPVLLVGFAKGWDIAFSGFGMAVNTINLISAAIALGLYFLNDFCMTIAKILCYINLFFGAIGLITSFFIGFYLLAAMNLLSLGIAGFMVYLLNYMGADWLSDLAYGGWRDHDGPLRPRPHRAII